MHVLELMISYKRWPKKPDSVLKWSDSKCSKHVTGRTYEKRRVTLMLTTWSTPGTNTNITREGVPGIPIETARQDVTDLCHDVTLMCHDEPNICDRKNVLWAFVFGSRTELIWGPSQLSQCHHIPTAQRAVISRFLCDLFLSGPSFLVQPVIRVTVPSCEGGRQQVLQEMGDRNSQWDKGLEMIMYQIDTDRSLGPRRWDSKRSSEYKRNPRWSSQVSFHMAHLKGDTNFHHWGFRFVFRWPFRVSSSQQRAVLPQRM